MGLSESLDVAQNCHVHMNMTIIRGISVVSCYHSDLNECLALPNVCCDPLVVITNDKHFGNGQPTIWSVHAG